MPKPQSEAVTITYTASLGPHRLFAGQLQALDTATREAIAFELDNLKEAILEKVDEAFRAEGWSEAAEDLDLDLQVD